MYVGLAHNVTGRIVEDEAFIADPSTREILRLSNEAKDCILFISSKERKVADMTEIVEHFQYKYEIPYEEATVLTFKLLSFLYDKDLVYVGSEKRMSLRKFSLFDSQSLMSAYLTLTKRCNLSCKGCGRERTKDLEVSTHVWKQFINQIYDWGILDLYFIGGEPLLRRDCVSLLKEAENCGIPSTLFTNCLVIDDRICDQLSKIDGLKVQVFLHGCSPSTCDPFVGVKGAYDKVISGIQSLVQHNIQVGVVSIMREETIDRMEDFLRLLVNLGVSDWTPSIALPVGCAYHDITGFHFSDHRFREFVDEYFDLLSVYKEALPARGTFNLHILQSKDRAWGSQTMSMKYYEPLNLYNLWVNIDSNGDLTPSYRLREYTLGNIKDKSVKEMLSNKSLIEQHKTAISSKLEKYGVQKRCDSCKYIRICNGVIPEIFNQTCKLGDKWCDPVKCRFFHLGFESILRHSTPPSYNILQELSNRS